MTTTLFSFVDLYRRQLHAAAHLLDKGVAFAGAQGASEQDMLGWRLAEDMHPLSFQLMVVINFSRAWPARVAGIEVPAAVTADLDVAGYRAAIADAKAFLATLTPDQFAGREDVPLKVQLGETMEPTLPAAQWLTVFGTTNVYFHLSMVYAILRMKGVKIGKMDLFAAGI
ncbi:MAG: DUF1993 domain-containing protein [Sphingomonas sp.]|nr:DUF1993 domain-containing protein [Sphingomonas sp.]